MTNCILRVKIILMNQHGTAIELNGHGILIVGPSGSGKSELAFELMGMGAQLVADDQVILTQENNLWIATCPDAIRGKIHLHDIGILTVPCTPSVKLNMIVQSSLPAERLSQPPEIGLEIITLDLKDTTAAKSILSMLHKKLA